MAGMNWQALANAVISRRVELGHTTRGTFVDASGISARILGDLETARRDSYNPATLARLEQALQWPAGRVDEILHSSVEADPVAVLAGLLRDVDGVPTLPPPADFPEGSPERQVLETVEQHRLSDRTRAWAKSHRSLADAHAVEVSFNDLDMARVARELPPAARLDYARRYWADRGAEPDPMPPAYEPMARVARHIHRDDFALAWLLARAGVTDPDLFRLELFVRRRREQQNVELLREVEEKIRELGGEVSYPWDQEPAEEEPR